MSGQGLAILRRDEGQLYAALDYGHSGAGHGHPDRLNFMLIHGANRWLDDVGTGSYVDPSLHWYRSTLAHNAPLVNGRSQDRVHGRLVAFDEQESAGWVRASVDDAAPGVTLQRTIVAMRDYVVDEMTWRSDRDVDVDLPFHVDGELDGAAPWTPATPLGSDALEDGFRFLTEAESASGSGNVRLAARMGSAVADARVLVDVPNTWWRARSYGAPGTGTARFHFVRATGTAGRVTTVWDVLSVVDGIAQTDVGVVVYRRDGSRHHHERSAVAWRITADQANTRRTTVLRGGVPAAERALHAARPARVPYVIPRVSARHNVSPLSFELGEPEYRRSEPSWLEAGKPAAIVTMAVDGDDLVIITSVKKRDVHFAAAAALNPLDNEHPDTNSDGIQLHVTVLPTSRSAAPIEMNWLMVPEGDASAARVTARVVGGAEPAMRTAWSQTAGGYTVRWSATLGDLGIRPGVPFRLGLIVNDMAADRERRRGQLVLGGAPGGFVFLRGDRMAADEQLDFVIADG